MRAVNQSRGESLPPTLSKRVGQLIDGARDLWRRHVAYRELFRQLDAKRDAEARARLTSLMRNDHRAGPDIASTASQQDGTS